MTLRRTSGRCAAAAGPVQRSAVCGFQRVLKRAAHAACCLAAKRGEHVTVTVGDGHSVHLAEQQAQGPAAAGEVLVEDDLDRGRDARPGRLRALAKDAGANAMDQRRVLAHVGLVGGWRQGQVDSPLTKGSTAPRSPAHGAAEASRADAHARVSYREHLEHPR